MAEKTLEQLEQEVLSLWSLRQYRAAHSLIESTSSSLKDQARILKEQSELGNHDLTDYYLNNTTPTAADYVGPVVIKKTLDGRGRGLFLTSDVSVGDLLLVSNPMACIQFDSPTRDHREELEKLVEAVCRTNSLANMQTESILRSGVPSMEIFQPNVELEVLESKFMSEIIYSLGRPARFYLPYDTGMNFKGLYPLRCFINHSCTRPNVSVQFCGTVCYVYASRCMKRGTELLSQYSSNLEDLLVRREDKKFCCRCPRCQLEERILTELKRHVDCFEESLRPGKLEEYMAAGRLSIVQKRWLRASYFHCYMLCYFKPDSDEYFGPLPALEEYIQECQAVGHEYILHKVILDAMMKFPDKEPVLRPLLVKEEVASLGHQKEEAMEALRARMK